MAPVFTRMGKSPSPSSQCRMTMQRRTALAHLLGTDDALADPHVLYGCHDPATRAQRGALYASDGGLFNVSFEVLLHDLTSTYFESDPPVDESDKRRHGMVRLETGK
jgi:hypothetical protein